MQGKARILVVDDELDITQILEYNLVKEGYEVQVCNDGKEAIKMASSFLPHVIILDIMMPEMDGIEVCETLRKDTSLNDTMIAFLTARSESFSQISALESGGDDYVTKPIKINVLVSRIKALLRRHPLFRNETNQSSEKFGDLELDYEKIIVIVKGKRINLAKKEFELLKLLVSKPGKVFKRNEILTQVWGAEVIVGDRTIDVHIRKLREKIGSNYIQTLKGIGYKFDY